MKFGDRVVLADVTLELPPTGNSVLMGQVGSGKSTLLRALAGLHNTNPRYQQWGTASLFGQPITPDWRPALVQQHARLLGARALDAARGIQGRTVPSALAAREQLVETLERARLGPLIERLDQKVIDLDTEWQRAVLLLGAAAPNPPMLLLDEPTSGLRDPEPVLRAIDFIGQRTKLLIVLHHQGQAKRIAQDVALLAGGRIQSHCSARTFFVSPPNAIVAHFVKTGSVSLPAPDARPEDLDEGQEPPPPLPEMSLNNICLEAAQAAQAVQRQPDLVDAPDACAPKQAQTLAAEPPAAVPLPLAVDMQPISTQRTPAAAPPPLNQAVEWAAKVGETTSNNVIPNSTISEHDLRVQRLLLAVAASAAPASVWQGPASRAPSGFAWVVPGKLAGTPQPGVTFPIRYDLHLLRTMGITTLITLTEDDLSQEMLRAYGLKNLHMPIYDGEAPTTQQTHILLARMRRLLLQGEVLGRVNTN